MIDIPEECDVKTVGELVEVLKGVPPDTPLRIKATAYDNRTYTIISPNRWKTPEGHPVSVQVYAGPERECIQLANTWTESMMLDED